MKDFMIRKLKYIVVPRVKQVWYKPWKHVVVYDVIQVSKGKRWNDPSYGNGGGCFMNFTEKKRVATFDSFTSAVTFRIQLKAKDHE